MNQPYIYIHIYMGFPGSSDGKESACNVGDLGLIPGLGRSPGGRAWQSTSVFLPGESHGQRSLVGYSPGGRKELGMTEGRNNKPRGRISWSYHSSRGFPGSSDGKESACNAIDLGSI